MAADEGCHVIMEGDINAKLGPKIIEGDPHEQSNNGALLWSLTTRNNLIVVNRMDVCEGVITRHRKTKFGDEKAVLDYFIISEGLYSYVTKMVVDEKRADVLTKFASKKGNRKMVESDHHLLSVNFNIKFTNELKSQRVEVFNFNNLDCQKLYLEETSTDKLTECFDHSQNIERNVQRFNKTFTGIVHKCFKKVRVCGKKPSKMCKQFQHLETLKNLKPKDEKTINAISSIQSEIQNHCAEENAQIIREQVQNLCNLTGNFSTNMMWKVKRKVCRRAADPPMAKKDPQGNLITAPSSLKQLYQDEYVHRLRHREIKPSFLVLKSLKDDLWERRFKLLSRTSSSDWSTEDVLKVLRSLKSNKCRDPLGFSNELFKPGVCGQDLVKAITLLMNSSKNQVHTPNLMTLTNISTIYKNKGSRFELVNDRGIFNMVIFRKILDKLIYNDKYIHIDSNMSDSNVGGRKGRNIRNHLFIVYGIINSISNKESPPVDFQFYDLKQCFDSMWLEESMNDLCSTIPEEEWDNKLAMVFQNNCVNQVAIKTPFGLTERVQIDKIVTQGGVWGPIQCSNQVDKVGKECVSRNKHLFKYKGTVRIMPLSMIDDVLAIAECGIKSVAVNAFINSKIEMNKLQFSTPKCKHLHVGPFCPFCPTLEVHGKEVDTTISEKYIGDFISTSITECNNNNISFRKNKGLGLVAQIMSILESVSLGAFVFEIAVTLRESLFINGILTSSETWYDLNKTQIEEFEEVDRLLLRSILRAPISTPREALYLELGLLPISYVIKGRRIMFLHYMLQLDESEMLSQFFFAQWNHPSKNDWVLTVKNDLEELGIDVNLSHIRVQSKETFKETIKDRCRKRAFLNLLSAQTNHSKMSSIKYDTFKLQSYFSDGSIDARTLFLYRTRMIRVSNNYKGTYGENPCCPLCSSEIDNQEHLLTCSEIHEVPEDVNYDDIFSNNTSAMKITLDALKSAFDTREEILKSRVESNENDTDLSIPVVVPVVPLP